MEIVERLKRIAEKKGKVTAKEREFVTALAADYEIKINPLCPDCVKDAAVEIYTRMTKVVGEPQVIEGFALVEGCNLIHNGERVNAATLTAANARKWLASGLPRKYFARIPEGE